MAVVTTRRPASNEYSPYHADYVALVPDGDLIAALERNGRDTVELLRDLGEERSGRRYAVGKWSIREVIGHMADAERVMSYRALCVARGDQTNLPSFDEVAWGKVTNAHARTLSALLADFQAARAATLALFRGFGPEEIERVGTANGARVSVLGLMYVVAGHERHHVKILKERYLNS